MSICVAGLTGQTGAGKSSVAVFLKEAGACIIDCDLLARQVTLPGSSVLEKLAERFPMLEVSFIDGGQSIYHWMLGVL